jgi:hypothetical protein
MILKPKAKKYKMKTTSIKQFLPIRLFAAALIVCSFSSCAKEIAKCEEWEVTYNCYIVSGIGGCGIDLSCGSRTLQQVFCGERLMDAKVGNTITISQAACETKTMTFNRFIKTY